MHCYTVGRRMIPVQKIICEKSACQIDWLSFAHVLPVIITTYDYVLLMLVTIR